MCDFTSTDSVLLSFYWSLLCFIRNVTPVIQFCRISAVGWIRSGAVSLYKRLSSANAWCWTYGIQHQIYRSISLTLSALSTTEVTSQGNPNRQIIKLIQIWVTVHDTRRLGNMFGEIVRNKVEWTWQSRNLNGCMKSSPYRRKHTKLNSDLPQA